MQTVTLYRGYNYDALSGGVFWGFRNVSNWPECSCEPYEVEIPDNFEIGENVAGERMFFKSGCRLGYTLTINRAGDPLLVGGEPVERVPLKVIGKPIDGGEAVTA